MATTTIGIQLIRYTCPVDGEADSATLRGRYIAQGFVELSAHILDVALGALGLVASAFTLFHIPELNDWAIRHFVRIEYLLCRPFLNFLTARTCPPDFEEPPAAKKDELKLPVCSSGYSLAIIEPASMIIKTAVESDYFFGRHVLSRLIGLTAGIAALVTLIGEKIIGLIAAVFALAIGDNKVLNYYAYDLLRIHEGFMLVPYFLYFGIIAPWCCVQQEPADAKEV